MIETKIAKKEVDDFLKKHFKSYVKTHDPFEKIIAYTNEDIVGLISYSIIYERAEVNYIVVNKQNRKNKIGSKLLNRALQDIKNHHCQNVSLEVEEDNIPAINLYLKYGFKKQGLRKNYYENKNAILMIKEMR